MSLGRHCAATWHRRAHPSVHSLSRRRVRRAAAAREVGWKSGHSSAAKWGGCGSAPASSAALREPCEWLTCGWARGRAKWLASRAHNTAHKHAKSPSHQRVHIQSVRQHAGVIVFATNCLAKLGSGIRAQTKSSAQGMPVLLGSAEIHCRGRLGLALQRRQPRRSAHCQTWRAKS